MTESATPPPDEIAGHFTIVEEYLGESENWELTDDSTPDPSAAYKAIQAIGFALRALAQENERHLERGRRVDKVVHDQYQRIGELEAETDRLRESVNAVRAEYLQRYMNATARIIELEAEQTESGK